MLYETKKWEVLLLLLQMGDDDWLDLVLIKHPISSYDGCVSDS